MKGAAHARPCNALWALGAAGGGGTETGRSWQVTSGGHGGRWSSGLGRHCEEFALTLSEVGTWEAPEQRMVEMFQALSGWSEGNRLCEVGQSREVATALVQAV